MGDMQGQIKEDGGDQQKFDDALRDLEKAGKQVGYSGPSEIRSDCKC